MVFMAGYIYMNQELQELNKRLILGGLNEGFP